jgi:periplasmic protein TonB
MFKLVVTFAAMFAIFATPTAAKAKDWGLVSGWYIASTGDSCGMFSSTASAGGSEAVILKRLDGALILQLKNPNWRIEAGKEYKVSFQIDGRAAVGAYRVQTMVSGFTVSFANTFENELQTGKMLGISRDGAVIDQLTLNGSSAALKIVQNCLVDLRTVPVPIVSALTRPPKPLVSAAKWFSAVEYPSSALRAERQGSVTYRLAVGIDGRANKCAVVTSSGSSDLDDATCSTLTRRARFTPAQSENGVSVEGVYEGKMTWVLPK